MAYCMVITSFYDNGAKSEKGKFINGKENSRFYYYRLNGSTIGTDSFANGLRVDTSYYYSRIGICDQKGPYVNGVKHGVWTYRDTTLGRLRRYMIYEKGNMVRNLIK